jgi:hypothetical protein
VENDEGHQEQPTPAHHPCREGRLDVSFDGVAVGSCRPTQARELDRGGDVKRHADEQKDPDKPEELSVAELRQTCFPEEARVSVDIVRASESLEIAQLGSGDLTPPSRVGVFCNRLILLHHLGACLSAVG